MKGLIALYLLFVCIYSAPTFNAQLDAPWTLFKRTFEKQYASAEEQNSRRSIWEANLALINKHNLEADLGFHTYTLGMNEFGDMTNEEFNKQMNGFHMNLIDKTSDVDRHIFRAPPNFNLPDSVDWRTKGYVTPVKNQGSCGSCWAFSAIATLEGQHFAKTQQLVSLSEQNLVDCTQNYSSFGCNGGWTEGSLQYIKDNNGIDTESSYPYEARTLQCRFDPKNVGATDIGVSCVSYQDEDALQSAIATVGPISVVIDASHSSFQLYREGVYNEPACSPIRLDHAVTAVGYGTQDGQDYYIVKNSWGTSWGNQGYIWMSRNKNNQCGIASGACYPLV